MGRPKTRTHVVGYGNCERFFGLWNVGNEYIDVFTGTTAPGSVQQARTAYERGEKWPGVVHVLNTTGDLAEDGMPKNGRTPDRYVKDELVAFVTEYGGDYLAAIDNGTHEEKAL